MDPNEQQGRNASFTGGATSVRQPDFAGFHKANMGRYNNRSVLDNYLPSGNGYSQRDRGRLGVDGQTSSLNPNGQSESTYATRQWLDVPNRTLG